MAEGNTWNKECPICKSTFVGDSCPECAAQAAVPTKVIPRANLFADAIKEAPSTHILPPGAEFKAGDKFHGLEILSIAGRGGMGAVFKARQVTLDRLVALKVLPTD
ncbi:MAG: hypothetical protein QF645_13765, partial [Planctomycetota bacterium]|nr:hypothetical protein [Planctomycetota bacterium]